MRPRRASDWVTDLNGRHEVEQKVQWALTADVRLGLLRSSTSSFERLDFQFVFGDHLVELELKAKYQPLSAGWRQLRPDVQAADLFVLDELALRKITDAGRFAFLLVWDAPSRRWCLWSTGDLLGASRARHTRKLDTPAQKSKGKLLFDLSEAGYEGTSLEGVIDAMVNTVLHLDRWWRDISPWPSRGAAST